MAGTRRFRNARGEAWDVWDVTPTALERRFQHPAIPPFGVERRQRRQFRANLGPLMANGWLIFAGGAERRRLGPIPPGWDALPDDDLARLLEVATPEASRIKR